MPWQNINFNWSICRRTIKLKQGIFEAEKHFVFNLQAAQLRLFL